MAIRRYARTITLAGGKQFGTSEAIVAIRDGIENGSISFQEHILQEKERLDILAGRMYNGDSSLYWIIAAASNIGWSLQVPPGTVLRIPTDLNQISAIVG